jgi:pyrroline-5-carboxylate reductase
MADATPLRIGFLGGGMMAEALAKGFVTAGVASAACMTVTDLSQARKDVFAAAGMAVAETSREARARSARPPRCAARSHCRRSEVAAASLATNPNPLTTHAARQVVERSDVLFVCVKPYGVKPLLQEVAPALNERHLIVSIAAGVTLADIEAASANVGRVVRVMPNTPCMIGASRAAARSARACAHVPTACCARRPDGCGAVPGQEGDAGGRGDGHAPL